LKTCPFLKCGKIEKSDSRILEKWRNDYLMTLSVRQKWNQPLKSIWCEKLFSSMITMPWKMNGNCEGSSSATKDDRMNTCEQWNIPCNALPYWANKASHPSQISTPQTFASKSGQLKDRTTYWFYSMVRNFKKRSSCKFANY